MPITIRKLNSKTHSLERIILKEGHRSLSIEYYPCDHRLTFSWCLIIDRLSSHQELQKDNSKSIDITFIS